VRVEQIVVMGVSGTGKTLVGERLAQHLGRVFVEGDALHPQANVDKMAAGVPLTDDDRWPWLRAIRDLMSEHAAAGRSAIVTCSALKRAYRDVLRETPADVRFLHLVADEVVIRGRLHLRSGHFMPESLLRSQYDTLEPLAPDEAGVTVSVDGTLDEVLARALAALELSSID
jgi:gluconokinase